MKPKDWVKKMREELGYTQVELEEKLGFSRMTLWDIEAYEDEMKMVVSAEDILKLADSLSIPLLCLLEERCPVCKKQGGEVVATDVNISELVRSKREEKGLSREELGDLVGVYEEAIIKIEESYQGSYQVIFKDFNIVMLKDLSKASDIPILTLLGRKCLNCGNDRNIDNR